MIKIRNHRRVALLLVLAMLATMFVGVGTASASDYVDVNSGWRYVDADSTDSSTGDITVIANDTLPAAADAVNVVVTLSTDGVTFANGTNEVSFVTDAATVATGKTYYGNSDLLIDVDEDVTGSISADVRVYAKDGNQYLFDETESQVIAKVSTGDTSVTAAKAKTVRVDDYAVGANITVKEINGTTGFDDEDQQKINFSIVTPGVEFNNNADDYNQFDLSTIDLDDANAYVDTDKRVVLNYYADDNAAEKIIFEPKLRVLPTANNGDEVKIKVYGDNIETTTVTVAKIGSYDPKISVTDGDEDFIYRGQVATFDNAVVKIDPAEDFDDGDYFTITLPKGVYFDEDDPLETNYYDADHWVSFEGLYNDDQTAWFTVDYDTDVDEDTLKLSDFNLEADADAAVGNLDITFGGDLEGTYTIGSIKNAFTVTTTPFALQSGKTSIEGANIVITETAEGALKDDNTYYYDGRDRDDYDYAWLDIELPAGMTFAETPDVEVTSGDLEIGDAETVYYNHDDDVLWIPIDEESSEASTITISGLVYSAYNQPMLGDVVAKVGADYNMVSNKYLEKLTVGSIATNPTAVYVIGASTFTVNGATQNVVTPSYIKNGRTYLAIRDVATGLGIDPVNVLWDAAAQKVTLVKGDKIVQVTIGSTTMYVNGVAIAMDVAPEISNGRAMLPAAWLAQAFNATASWDAATQTVTLK